MDKKKLPPTNGAIMKYLFIGSALISAAIILRVIHFVSPRNDKNAARR